MSDMGDEIAKSLLKPIGIIILIAIALGIVLGILL